MPDKDPRRPLEEAPQSEPVAGAQADAGRLAPARVVFNLDGIPQELRGCKQWVAWKVKAPSKPGAKFGKVPINPHTGGAAKSTDPKTWGTFDQALERMKRDGLPGIGFVFTEEVGIVGIDLDHCINPDTREVAKRAVTIIERLKSYTEITPSGTGVHVLGKGSLPPKGRKKGNVEMYETARFFTVTGCHLVGTPSTIEERTKELHALHAEVFGSAVQETNHSAPEPQGLRLDDPELVRKATAAKNGEKFESLWRGDHGAYPSQSEADLALCGLLAFWTGGDPTQIDSLFRRSGLMRVKWDELRGGSTYGQRTMEAALAGMTEFYRSKPNISEPQGSLPFTDTGNAERLVRRFGQSIRFCHPWKKWLIWDKRRWRYDTTGVVMRYSKVVVREMYREAASCSKTEIRDALAEWARRCEKVDRRKAMIELAKSEEGIPILPEQFDRDPWALNCRNGTLDLRTGELRPHRKEDYITKLVPHEYEAGATCPTWDAFLLHVVPDVEVRDFLRRGTGYSLSGDQGEQVLFFSHGGGANGKSTFLGAIIGTLGSDFAIQAAADLLLDKNGSHPTERADLFGVRFAVCNEIGQGRSFDEVLVKQLTGGDRIRARRMREDFWEFDPTHHLWLGANHLPIVRGTDYAIWRRVLLIPFTVQIPLEERDRDLPAKLRKELPGILAWAVRGCMEWQRGGLRPPRQVLLATQDYRAEMDLVGGFLADRCVGRVGARIGATNLYGEYKNWCSDTGAEPISQTFFGSALREKGLVKRKQGGVQVYLDIGLRNGAKRDGDTWGQSGPDFGIDGFEPPTKGVMRERGPDCPQLSPRAEADRG